MQVSQPNVMAGLMAARCIEATQRSATDVIGTCVEHGQRKVAPHVSPILAISADKWRYRQRLQASKPIPLFSFQAATFLFFFL